ncbi:hypothetical protein QYF36_009622 [Acer negundo]|nr:hypothetical protein QYF36_009622 [Acer negundo]
MLQGELETVTAILKYHIFFLLPSNISVAYEDHRSTTLAVDNLNGAQILGRIIRVDLVTKYKKKEEGDEETEQRKREERGVCRDFQRVECTRGAGCKFSHDEQRAANTGQQGAQDKE